MLFVLFQIGGDRFALEATQVVEIIPLVALTRLPQAPAGVAGLFNYHGRPVIAVDLCKLAHREPAADQLSTRIIVVRYPAADGVSHLVGLVAEQATGLLRKEPGEFIHPGARTGTAAYLGPVFLDSKGPIQWVHEQRLLPEKVCNLLRAQSGVLAHEAG
jgi:chemotaxis-related protein WspB